MLNTQLITSELIDKGYTFSQYLQLIEGLLAENKTTGTGHSEFMVEYTKLNMQRMKRLVKTTVLIEELRGQLENLQTEMVWLVITEGWCGDAAQIVPVMAEIAKNTSKIQLSLILRDEHPEIMDQYLTNGSRSIPKLVCLEAGTLKELGSWGPRPAAAQEMIMEAKKNPDLSQDEFIHKVHKWYADNKTLDTQKELLEKLKEWDRKLNY